MARYVAWLGKLGTIKASSLELYMSVVNGFFRDHCLEPVALGDLVDKVRKGLAASLVTIDDTPMRVHFATSIVVNVLRMAQALRLQLSLGIDGIVDMLLLNRDTRSLRKITNVHDIPVTVTQKDSHRDNQPEAWCRDIRSVRVVA
jgi:hypothetical protein